MDLHQIYVRAIFHLQKTTIIANPKIYEQIKAIHINSKGKGCYGAPKFTKNLNKRDLHAVLK